MWAMPPVHFALYFGDEVSWTVYPRWPQTVILLISLSQVAGITGVNHWRPPCYLIFIGGHILVFALSLRGDVRQTFFKQSWGLNSGASCLSHVTRPFFLLLIFQAGSYIFFCLSGPRPQSSDLQLLCSWGDKHIPPQPFFVKMGTC
jgi:hypothetical protein